MQLQSAEFFGIAAAFASLYAAQSRTIIPLRWAAIAANALAMVYSALHGTYPTFMLNLVLLPVNAWRLHAMIRLVHDLDASLKGDLNADWLLPNRLYEGAQNGAIPIALRHSETGRWVGEHGLGLLVDLPLEEAVFGLLKGMTQQAYAASVNKLRTSDRSLFEWTDAACEQLVSRLGSLRRAPALAR